MKTTISIILLVLSLNVFSQIKGDNKILIPNLNANGITIETIKKVFTKNFYVLDEFDLESKTFSTKEHPIEGSVFSYSLQVKLHGFIERDTLSIVSTYTSEYPNLNGGMAKGAGYGVYGKRKLVASRLTFDEMVRLGNLISNEVIFLKDANLK